MTPLFLLGGMFRFKECVLYNGFKVLKEGFLWIGSESKQSI